METKTNAKQSVTRQLIESIFALTSINETKSKAYYSTIVIDLRRSKIVATNGAVLAQHLLLDSDADAIKMLYSANDLESQDNRVMFSVSDIKIFKALLKDKKETRFYVTTQSILGKDFIVFGNANYNVCPCEKRTYFPQYAQVIPEQNRTVKCEIRIDLKQLKDLYDAMQHENKDKTESITLKVYSDEAPIVVTSGSGSRTAEVNLLMPLRR